MSLLIRQQREHSDQSGGVEHDERRMGLRKPYDQRDLARLRRQRDLQVRSVWSAHLQVVLVRYEHLRL